MDKLIQFIQITPEQLQNEIMKGVIAELQQFKKDFQPKEPVELLTRNEVAKMLKIDLSSVHNWTKSGKIIAYGISGRVYYKKSEIEQSIKQL